MKGGKLEGRQTSTNCLRNGRLHSNLKSDNQDVGNPHHQIEVLEVRSGASEWALDVIP